MAETSDAGLTFARTEQRIAKLTLAFGMAGATVTAFFFSWSNGLGVLIGAALAWLNFRWLRRGMDALVQAASDPTGPRPQQAQVFAALRTAGRYALLGVLIYVIFKVFGVPILSMLLGLCALGAAATTTSLYEILHSSE
ncbi:MAG TPA: ATP synthase subunit I [Candidatus Dormibacteraeota bacterium]|nr:ATP synthase subunit I [Candidatus Dormibacteraeota bacterium]